VKTIIAGSRDASMLETLTAIDACPWWEEITHVVTGGARGADEHGEAWADRLKLSVTVMPALWRIHGKAAGPIRNRAMAETADALIAVWDGESRGTRNMIHEATKRELRVFVWRTDAAGRKAST
jgi:hypothetical protein